MICLRKNYSGKPLKHFKKKFWKIAHDAFYNRLQELQFDPQLGT